MTDCVTRRAFCRVAAAAAAGVCLAPAGALARGLATARTGASPGVFLTIDDGPRKSTVALCDALRAEDRAAFFLIGEQITGARRDAALHVLGRGHALGNHSQTHPHFSKISLDAARAEILRAHDRIQSLYDAAGLENPLLFRYPYGDHGAAHKARVQAFIEGLGYTIYDWDIDTRDYRYYMKVQGISRGGIMDRCAGARSGDVVLCHDYEQTGLWIIRTLQKRFLLLPLAGSGGRNLFETPEQADQQYELRWDSEADIPEIAPPDDLLAAPCMTNEELLDLEFDGPRQKRLGAFRK